MSNGALAAGSALALLGVTALVVGLDRPTAPPVIGYDGLSGHPAVVELMRARVAADPLPVPVEFRLAPGVPFHGAMTVRAPDSVLTAAAALASEAGLVGVVGFGSSPATLAVAPYFDEARVPLVIPTATADALADVGPWAFRIVPGNSAEAAFMADFARSALGARRAIVFFVTDEYGVELRDALSEAFVSAGGRILDRVPVRRELGDGSNDYETLVDQALTRGPADVVFFAVRSNEAIPLGEALGRRTSVPVVAGDGVSRDDDLLEAAPGLADGLYRVRFWHADADAASQAFAREFAAVTGHPPTDHDAAYYDALLVLVEAVRAVGGDRDRVRDFLAGLGEDGRVVEGLTGPLAFAGSAPARLVMVHTATDSIVARTRIR